MPRHKQLPIPYDNLRFGPPALTTLDLMVAHILANGCGSYDQQAAEQFSPSSLTIN
jgi:hypothetical protein